MSGETPSVMVTGSVQLWRHRLDGDYVHVVVTKRGKPGHLVFHEKQIEKALLALLKEGQGITHQEALRRMIEKGEKARSSKEPK